MLQCCDKQVMPEMKFLLYWVWQNRAIYRNPKEEEWSSQSMRLDSIFCQTFENSWGNDAYRSLQLFTQSEHACTGCLWPQTTRNKWRIIDTKLFWNQTKGRKVIWMELEKSLIKALDMLLQTFSWSRMRRWLLSWKKAHRLNNHSLERKWENELWYC